MDLYQIINSEKEINSLKELNEETRLNFDFISQLETEADNYMSRVESNNDAIDKFVEGDQWTEFALTTKPGTSYNQAGNPVYDFRNTYNSENADSGGMRPKRTINLTKSYLETLVAQFAEVEPFPMAKTKHDYVDDDDLKKKVNALFDIGFRQENNLDELYEYQCYNALKYTHAVWMVVVDEDHSKTDVPIKIRAIDPKAVRFDPEAPDVNECDYFLHKQRTRYYDLMQRYEYKFDPDQNGEMKEEPKFTDPVEVKYWWFRVKVKINKGKAKTLWLMFPTFNNQWILPKDKDGKVNMDTVLDTMMYEKLPYVIQRAVVTKGIEGESQVPKLMSSQIEYNKTASMSDWNYGITSDPPFQTNMSANDVRKANKPGGVLFKQGTGQNFVTKLDAAYIPQSESGIRRQSIKEDFSDLLGINVNLMQGERPKGTYTGAMVKALEKINNLKPQMMEAKFLTAIEELAWKYLYIFSKYFDGSSVTVFSPEDNEDIKISPNDINNVKYRIEIETKDINLLSGEAKYKIITEFMQYSAGNPMLLYLMAQITENNLPHIFPKNVMDDFKDIYEGWKKENEVKQLTLETQLVQLQAQIDAAKNPPAPQPGQANQTANTTPANQPGGAGQPQQQAAPPADNQPQQDDIDPQEFIDFVEDQKTRMMEAGLDTIPMQPGSPIKVMDALLDEVVTKQIEAGTPKSEIMLTLEGAVNKVLDASKTIRR